MTVTKTLNSADLSRAREVLDRVTASVGTQVVGQDRLVEALLVGLMARGHVLLESVPGLAKTLAASALASSVDAEFSRVQCTPDLLPSDIVGTQVFDIRGGEFVTQLGPVHANFVLLDEINRSSAKTQSAMLEAMQERQTSIGGVTYPLPEVFMVLATQNPIEEEGTYVLPQAQMDRFLLKEVITYPTPTEEFEVLRRLEAGVFDLARDPADVGLDDVLFLQKAVRQIHVADSLKRYIIELVNVTREPGRHLGGDQARHLEFGSSPRGVIAFMLAARASALLAGRDHALPEDIKRMAYPVLRHRMLLTFEAVAERVRVEDIIDSVLAAVPVP